MTCGTRGSCSGLVEDRKQNDNEVRRSALTHPEGERGVVNECVCGEGGYFEAHHTLSCRLTLRPIVIVLQLENAEPRCSNSEIAYLRSPQSSILIFELELVPRIINSSTNAVLSAGTLPLLHFGLPVATWISPQACSSDDLDLAAGMLLG